MEAREPFLFSGASVTYTSPKTNRNGTGESLISQAPVQEVPKHPHFYMSAKLDTTRIGRDVQKLVEEVISHLTSVNGAQVELTLELDVKSPEGMSQQVVRTVSENCQTLRVRSFGFDE